MSIKDGPGEGGWAVFAEKVVAERDKALEIAAAREEEREYARRAEHAAIAKRVIAERERDQKDALSRSLRDRLEAMTLRAETAELELGLKEAARAQAQHWLDEFQGVAAKAEIQVMVYRARAEKAEQDVARLITAIVGSPSHEVDVEGAVERAAILWEWKKDAVR